ncbi:hypothetical protein R69888_03256 [Paraburkholderia haematera]|uniref:Uncharacterized protein n=1 Tax=Paraburkholderia haematera TaxID=2793077 RepID=A0ABM8RKF3_9BURK|nr:hypothetical protein R69888_03256 [Paraburkholderia haematera]
MLHCNANDAGFPSLSRGSKNGSLTVALEGIWGINVASFVTSFVQFRHHSSRIAHVREPLCQFSRGPVQNTLFNVSEGGTS